MLCAVSLPLHLHEHFGVLVQMAVLENVSPCSHVSLHPGLPLEVTSTHAGHDFLGGNLIASITYTAGPNHNSAAILVQKVVTVVSPGTSAVNNYVLVQNGANLNLTDNNVLVAPTPTLLTASLNISVAAGTSGSLTIDYSGGTFATAVTFDGGTGAGRTLTLKNGSYTNAVYTYTGANSGSVNLDGEAILYSDVTGITSTVTASNDAFNLLPAAQATLQNGNTQTPGTSELLSSNQLFVPTTFVDPAAGLSINAQGSNSLIQLGAMDAHFAPATETFAGPEFLLPTAVKG